MDEKLKAIWAVEVKWTDRFFERPQELKSLIQFCHANNIQDASITTLTKSGRLTFENVGLRFVPASVYCYTVGYNIVKRKKRFF